MRYLMLILVLVGFGMCANNAYAMPSFSSQEIYDFSSVIVLGKVISVDSTFSPTHNLYEIKVEKYLKNPQDADMLFAAGQKTVNVRLGNTVFNVNDRGLFFLMNYTVGYDNPSKIFGMYPTSRLIDPEWDKCNIFEKNVPREHWTFGGVNNLPIVRQGNNTDNETFKIRKEITIMYDIFNHSPIPKNTTYGILVKNLDDPDTLYKFTEINNAYILEPCTSYKTLTWSFTPSKPGHYSVEMYDLKGSRMEIGFVVFGDEPSVGDKNSGVNTADDSNKTANYVNYQDLVVSRAKCTFLGINGVEACSLQSSLMLGIITSAIIGTVVAISMLTLRRRK